MRTTSRRSCGADDEEGLGNEQRGVPEANLGCTQEEHQRAREQGERYQHQEHPTGVRLGEPDSRDWAFLNGFVCELEDGITWIHRCFRCARRRREYKVSGTQQAPGSYWVC